MPEIPPTINTPPDLGPKLPPVTPKTEIATIKVQSVEKPDEAAALSGHISARQVLTATAEAPQGWGKIEVEPVVDDEPVEVLTSEKVKEPEMTKKRRGSAKRIVKKNFPSVDYEEALAKQRGVPKEKLNVEDRDYTDYNTRQAAIKRRDLVEKVMAADVPMGQLEEYIDTLMTLDRATTGTDAPKIDSVIQLSRVAPSLEKARLYSKLSAEWQQKFSSTDPKINQQRLQKIRGFITDCSGVNWSGIDPPSSAETSEMFKYYSAGYELLWSLPTDYNQEIVRTVENYGLNVISHSHRAERMAQALDIFQQVYQSPDVPALNTFMDSTLRYGGRHLLSEQMRKGLVENLLPAIQRKDPQVAILLKGGNIWGMRDGDFGVADFLCHAYASEINPANINELMMVIRDIPTMEYAKYEQNRKDALSLRAPFGGLRDFIHDQRPNVHEVVDSMVEYYDTGDNGRLRAVIEESPSTGYVVLRNSASAILDRSRYDTPITEKIGPEEHTVKAIDVLRRVQANTVPVPDEPPITTDDELNKRISQIVSGRTSGQISKDHLNEALHYTNKRLMDMMAVHTVGIEPETVQALSWLERQSYNVLQNLTFEEQVRAYRSDWFHSILQFQELTMSPDVYSHTVFEDFIAHVDREHTIGAYELIGRHTLHNVDSLGTSYRSGGQSDKADALLTGNVAHELAGLIDLRDPATPEGERYKNEFLTKPESERLKGD